MNQVIQITDHFHYNKICYPLPQQDSIKNWNKNINALERYGIYNVTLPILLLERYIFFAILLIKTKHKIGKYLHERFKKIRKLEN